MEEKKYHIEESKIAGDKVCEPSPAYASVASESVSHHVIDSGIEQEVLNFLQFFFPLSSSFLTKILISIDNILTFLFFIQLVDNYLIT